MLFSHLSGDLTDCRYLRSFARRLGTRMAASTQWFGSARVVKVRCGARQIRDPRGGPGSCAKGGLRALDCDDCGAAARRAPQLCDHQDGPDEEATEAAEHSEQTAARVEEAGVG